MGLATLQGQPGIHREYGITGIRPGYSAGENARTNPPKRAYGMCTSPLEGWNYSRYSRTPGTTTNTSREDGCRPHRTDPPPPGPPRPVRVSLSQPALTPTTDQP